MENYLPDLKRAFGFTDEDLHANQNGQMTPEQRRKLKYDREQTNYRKNRLSIKASLILYLVIFIILFVVSSLVNLAFAFIVIVITLLCVVAIRYVMNRYKEENINFQTDMQNREAHFFEDTIEIEIEKVESLKPQFYMFIKNQKFKIEGHEYALLKKILAENPNQTFIVYYTPYSMNLLSVTLGSNP